MSNEDRLAVTQWPAPQLVGISNARAELVDNALKTLRVHPATSPEIRAQPHGWRARVALVKEALRFAAEIFIPRAEMLVGAGGPEKKAIVKRELLAVLKALELRVKLIPGPLEIVAWWAISRAIDGIIETVFRQLEARGIVNVGAGHA